MIVLGIETSCDETAAAVVQDGNVLLSNVVFSSMDLHTIYGGVVPEIAARSHIESIIPVIEKALREAFGDYPLPISNELTIDDEQLSNNSERLNSNSRQIAKGQRLKAFDPWDQIDAIAVTYGAGLGGSLLVGVMSARTLAITKNKPLYAINHVEGHVYANFITKNSIGDYPLPISNELTIDDEQLSNNSERLNSNSRQIAKGQRLKEPLLTTSYLLPSKQPEFPLLALIVSGGHSQLVLFRDHFDYSLLGQTQDDAIGEAFDKVAKILGLPYPGGPSVGKKALEGNSSAFSLPKAKMSNKYDFSFSGLKTAVLRHAQAACGKDFTFPSHALPEMLSESQKADIAAVFQRVAIETVVDKTIQAYEEFSPASVVIAGGVAANTELRRQLSERLPIEILYTDPSLCTDNGAMAATLGCFKMKHNQPTADPYTLQIEPNLSM